MAVCKIHVADLPSDVALDGKDCAELTIGASKFTEQVISADVISTVDVRFEPTEEATDDAR